MNNLNTEITKTSASKIDKKQIQEIEKQKLYEDEFKKLNEQEKSKFIFYKNKFSRVRERTLFKRFKNNFWIIHAMSESLLDTHKCHTDWFKRAYTALNALGETKVMQKVGDNENLYKIICDELNRMKKERQELSLAKKCLQKKLSEDMKPIVEKPKLKVEPDSKNNNQKNKLTQVRPVKKTLEIKVI